MVASATVDHIELKNTLLQNYHRQRLLELKNELLLIAQNFKVNLLFPLSILNFEKTMGYKAFIFDLNGTLIDDMEYHEKAWGKVLNNELMAGLSQTQLKAEMYGKSEEMFERVFGKNRFSAEEIADFARRKEMQYQADFAPFLQPISGLTTILERAKATGIKLAIGSAAQPFNVDFALDGLGLRHFFDVIVTADDVHVSKPDPTVFLLAAEQMGVSPKDCLVFEDAPKGVEAAKNGGMNAVVVLSYNDRGEFLQFDNVVAMVKDFSDVHLNGILWG